MSGSLMLHENFSANKIMNKPELELQIEAKEEKELIYLKSYIERTYFLFKHSISFHWLKDSVEGKIKTE